MKLNVRWTLWRTRADKFKVGWTPINKEKQGTRGRPKKYVQEARFNTATLTLSSPTKFAQPTRNSKKKHGNELLLNL